MKIRFFTENLKRNRWLCGAGLKHVWMENKNLIPHLLPQDHRYYITLFFSLTNPFNPPSPSLAVISVRERRDGGWLWVNTGPNLWHPAPAPLHCNLHTRIQCSPSQVFTNFNLSTLIISTDVAALENPRRPVLPVFGASREKLSQILTARAKMAVAGSPYGQQRNSVVCALIGGEEGRGCVLIGRFWQPPARICTASLGTLRDRLWAGQWQGRIPPAMFGKDFDSRKVFHLWYITATVRDISAFCNRSFMKNSFLKIQFDSM